MTAGLVLTAFGLGLRHGIDWDHIAAIADLTGSARSRRRGFALSVLYAAGHGLVVLLLGAIAVSFGAALPSGVDAWMGRLVGASLVLLGVWVLVELRTKGAEFRLRSRWMLILDGTFAGLRRVRRRGDDRRVSVAHVHPHDHEGDAPDHGAPSAHDHAHVDAVLPVGAGHPSGPGTLPPAPDRSRRHAHGHRHDLLLPSSPSARYESGTATGVGMLHGVGVESPTQIAVFVASTSVAGRGTGLLLVVVWVVGLLVANAGLAAVASGGLLRTGDSRLYRAVAVVVAVGSLTLGLLYLGGFDTLPGIAT